MSDPSVVARTALLVVGPPRSGTSAVCHVLNKLGLNFGDPDNFVDPETNRHNPVFFELSDLNRLNDDVLEALGWSYGEFNALPLEADFDSQLADRFEARIEEFLDEHFAGKAVFGLKDPRFCFTLPLWTMVLRRLGVRARHLLTVRDPASIAASNYRLTPEKGMQHSRRIQPMSEGAARYFLQDLDFQTVHFEALASNTQPVRDVIASLVASSDDDVRQAIDDVIDSALVHWRQPTLVATNADASSTDLGTQYRQLAELARSFELPISSAGSILPAEGAGGVLSVPLGTSSAWLPDRTSGGVVQIFHRKSESTYSEDNSRSAPWPAHTHEAAFEIDLGAEVEADYLRVDFDDYPGAFFLRALSVDGADTLPSVAISCGSGVVLVGGIDGWVGLISNHSDPWVELALDAGSVRSVRVELTRISLAQVTHRLAQAQSVDKKLDLLQARLSKLDDRWMHNSSRLEEGFNGHVAGLSEQVSRVDQAIGGTLTSELKKLEMRLDLEQQGRLEALSEMQSQGAQVLSILHSMQMESKRRLGDRFRAWLGRGDGGDRSK